jgi:hypothetical protein
MVLPDMVTARVLVMQYIGGHKLNQYGVLRRAGADVKELTRLVCDGVAYQMCVVALRGEGHWGRGGGRVWAGQLTSRGALHTFRSRLLESSLYTLLATAAMDGTDADTARRTATKRTADQQGTGRDGRGAHGPLPVLFARAAPSGRCCCGGVGVVACG